MGLGQFLQGVLVDYLLILSLAELGLFGYDKLMAVTRRWRIPERVLLTIGLAGGAWGALLGMVVFRHKIRRARFWITLVPPAVVYLALLILISDR